MSYETVKDLLDRIKKMHADLSATYENQEKMAKKARVKLLLDYLKTHEQKLEHSIAAFEKDSIPSTMSTISSFCPDPDRWEFLKNLTIDPEADLKDVIDEVLEADQCLMDIYTEIICKTDLQAVKDIFHNILTQAKKDRKTFVRDAMMMEEF